MTQARWCSEMVDEDHVHFSSLRQALAPLSLSTTGNGCPLQPTPLAPSPQVQASWQGMGCPRTFDKLRGWAPQSEGFKQHPSPAGWLSGYVSTYGQRAGAAAVLPTGCVLPGTTVPSTSPLLTRRSHLFSRKRPVPSLAHCLHLAFLLMGKAPSVTSRRQGLRHAHPAKFPPARACLFLRSFEIKGFTFW